jgi:hypothetical protein
LPTGATQAKAKLILVLVATLKGPRIGRSLALSRP